MLQLGRLLAQHGMQAHAALLVAALMIAAPCVRQIGCSRESNPTCKDQRQAGNAGYRFRFRHLLTPVFDAGGGRHR